MALNPYLAQAIHWDVQRTPDSMEINPHLAHSLDWELQRINVKSQGQEKPETATVPGTQRPAACRDDTNAAQAGTLSSSPGDPRRQAVGVSCGTCRWWANFGPLSGHCHRYAPLGDRGWPKALEFDWCGEYKPDQGKF